MKVDDTLFRQWSTIGPVETSQMIDARLQLHHAAQLTTAIGRYLLSYRPDHSHTSMYWNADRRYLQGEPVGDDEPVSGALRPGDLTILLVDERRGKEYELQLNEITIGEGLYWVETQLEEMGINVDALSLEVPYEIPEHPVGDGKPFKFHNPIAFQALGAYWSNADLLLRAIARGNRQASAVRCWPHHFDIATLVTIRAHEDPEQARTIGVGLSPGDGNYPTPYFYVTPWPYPNLVEVQLPPLENGGEWHVDGWIGAVLTSTRLAGEHSAHAQCEQAALFLTEAVEAVKRMF